MPAVAGRPAGPSGGLCHVAAAKTKQKEGKKATEAERKRERLFAAAVQRHGRGRAEGDERVAAGE